MFSSSYMPRKFKQRGPFFPIDAEWKEAIKALMEKRKMTQAELARRTGASPPAIVLLFKPQTVQSGLVPAIHRVLGLAAPGTTTIDELNEAKRRLERAWAELSEEERDLLVRIAERFRIAPR